MRNVELNGLNGKIKILHKDILNASHADIGVEADVVFTNPPYMKTDSGKRNLTDYKYIARHEVCGSIDDFCASAFKLLKHGGKFYAVWRPDRMTDLIFSMRSNRLEPKTVTFVHADKSSAPSMMLVSAIKGGASGMTVTPPLFLYSEGNRTQMTEEAAKIYDTMSF